MHSIHQVLADMQYGDAITDNALAIKKVLVSEGFESEIYAINIHPSLAGLVHPISEFKSADCVFHHFAIGSEINDFVKNLSVNKKVLVYHNITPPEFFEGYNLKSMIMCKTARCQLKSGVDAYDYALAVSEFNRAELIELGYRNTAVIPILYDYSRAVKFEHTSKFNNILFLGRIAPNKCQQDVIKAFYSYKKFYNSKACLYIAGAYNGMEKYLNELVYFTHKLGISDSVYFTGRLSYEQMYRLYSNTDLFLSMSQHEGFCVPIVECMHFEIPILAYEAGAVPETMGKSGVTFNKKDYMQIASMMDEMIINLGFRKRIIDSQNIRLIDFSYDAVSKKLKNVLCEIELS